MLTATNARRRPRQRYSVRRTTDELINRNLDAIAQVLAGMDDSTQVAIDDIIGPSGGGGGAAPGDAQFLTLANTTGLSAERKFTPSTGIEGTDGGANSTYTVTAWLSTGYAGGQTAYGGTLASEDLTLTSTAHATKGTVFFGSAQTSGYDEANNRLGIGDVFPDSKVHAEDNTDSDADVEVMTIGRSRSSSTTPGLGFGGHLSWRLEGFTNNSSVDAVQVGGAWRGPQSNDTTARDSYWYVSTMLDATLGERLRVDSSGGVTITQAAMGSSAQRALLLTPGAHTGNPASNELSDIYFNLQRTETWNAGTVAAQRAFFIDRPTYGSASGSAVFTYATTVAIAGPPAATTGGEITAGYAMMIGTPSASTAMGDAVAGSLWASLRLSAQVVAYTGTTTITSDGPSQASIGQLTVSGSSVMVVDNAQAIHLSPPHASSSAVIKKLTGIRVTGSSTAGTAQAASIYRVYYQEALTVTYTGTTGITSDQGLGNIALEQITFTDSSACTISYLSGIAVNIPTTASSMAATEISGVRIANNVRQGAAAAGMIYVTLNLVANTLTYTGTTGITSTQGVSSIYAGQITVTDASALTITNARGLYVTAPTAGGSVKFTNLYAAQIGASTTQGAAQAASVYVGLNIPAHTLTFTGSTGITVEAGGYVAAQAIGVLTVTDADALTVWAAAGLYIAGAPVQGGSVTITDSYALWVDSGISRFDGRWNLSKVTSISSAGTMTFGAGVYQEITTDGGDVNYITTTGWTAGSFVIMRNNSATTIALNHNAGSVPANTAALNMTGGAAVTWGVNDCLLMMYDGTSWTQITAQLALSVA